jgi:acyl-CoA synthetase (AMP-forming)/AMP-acid ligase II
MLPDDGSGEELVVLCERSRTRTALADAEIVAAARQRVIEHVGLRPDKVVMLEPGTLPRTSNGKIRRNETLRRYLTGTLSPPKPVTRWRLAGELLRSSLAFARQRQQTSK